MATSAGILTLDVVPKLDRLGTDLTTSIENGPAGVAAKKAGESLASKIGDGLHNLGDQIGGELGSIVSRAGSGFDSFAKAGDHLGLKLAAVGGAALGLGTALQVMGSADQAAQQQLEAAITATGASWSDYQGQVEKAISTGENFNRSAADTMGALQALTSATGDPAKALQYLGVTFDLAAARHIDLVSAANLVAKALDGNTRLLKAYGISTDGVATSTAKAADAVDQLGVKLQGQAAASVDTFAGKFGILKTKLTDMVSSLAGPVGAGLQGFGAATAIVGGIMETKFIGKIKSAITAADGFGKKLLAGVGAISPWVLGITAIATAVGFFAQAQANATGDVQAFTDTLDKQTGSVTELSRAWIASKLTENITQKTEWDRLAKDGFSLATTLDALAQAAAGNSGPLDALKKHLADVQHQASLSTGELGNDSQILHDYGNAVGFVNDTVNDSPAKLALQTLAMSAAGGAVDGLKDRNSTLLTGLKDTRNTLIALRLATIAAIDPILTLDQAEVGGELSALQWKDSLYALTETIKGNKGALSENTVAGRENREALLSRVQSALADVAAGREQGKTYDQLAPKYKAQIDQIEAAGVKAGLTKEQVRLLIGKYKDIPAFVSTDIKTPGMIAAQKAADRLLATLTEIIGTFAIKMPSGLPGLGGMPLALPTTPAFFKPGKAAGGPVSAGTAYTVGELGPETFTPTTSGWITPHNGGNTVIIQNPPPGNVEDQAFAAMRRLDLLYAR